MEIDKFSLFEATKALWPSTIDLLKDPTGLHDIYWALEGIIPADGNWQQIAMWPFHQALDELAEKARKEGVSKIDIHTLPFADFDRWMRSNLNIDASWLDELAAWESNANTS